MSVELEPAELGFKRPYSNEVSQTLSLRNGNKDPVAFKVKTTAPKQYCVRPNSGTIQPGETVDVSVVLQPMKTDPPQDARCKDKFLVQSVAVPGQKEMPPWAELERSFKSSIQERKIRVHYLPADGSSAQPNGVEEHVDDSTMSPPPVYTPHAQTSSTMTEASTSPQQTPKSTDNDTLTSQTRGAGGTESLAQTSREQLEKMLTEAQATIAKLKNEAAENMGLRRRNVDSKDSKHEISSGTMGVLPTQGQQIGVPVGTVALIALFVFLLTYFLF